MKAVQNEGITLANAILRQKKFRGWTVRRVDDFTIIAEKNRIIKTITSEKKVLELAYEDSLELAESYIHHKEDEWMEQMHNEYIMFLCIVLCAEAQSQYFTGMLDRAARIKMQSFFNTAKSFTSQLENLYGKESDEAGEGVDDLSEYLYDIIKAAKMAVFGNEGMKLWDLIKAFQRGEVEYKENVREIGRDLYPEDQVKKMVREVRDQIVELLEHKDSGCSEKTIKLIKAVRPDKIVVKPKN